MNHLKGHLSELFSDGNCFKPRPYTYCIIIYIFSSLFRAVLVKLGLWLTNLHCIYMAAASLLPASVGYNEFRVKSVNPRALKIWSIFLDKF